MPAVRARLSAVVLLVLALVAAWARTAHLHAGYAHPDEPIIVGVVNSMRESGDWDTNWAKADVPAMWRYDTYNFSSYLHATHLFELAVRAVPGTVDYAAERRGLLVYRLLSALLAMAAVALTWVLARRLGGMPTGFIAVALTAIAPLLVQDAHYARPESFCTALMLVATLLLWPREAWSGRRVLAAAAVLGLLIA